MFSTEKRKKVNPLRVTILHVSIYQGLVNSYFCFRNSRYLGGKQILLFIKNNSNKNLLISANGLLFIGFRQEWQKHKQSIRLKNCYEVIIINLHTRVLNFIMYCNNYSKYPWGVYLKPPGGLIFFLIKKVLSPRSN